MQLWLLHNVSFADTVDTFNTSLKSQLFRQAVNPQKAQNSDSVRKVLEGYEMMVKIEKYFKTFLHFTQLNVFLLSCEL